MEENDDDDDVDDYEPKKLYLIYGSCIGT